MKRSIEERGPIAAWLIRSRDRFSEPDTDHTWTVEEFLPALHSATGWSPARTTYARWESGAVRPTPKNLRRIEGFYAERGVPGLEETPKTVEPAPDLAAALMALAVELTAAREERARYLALEGTVKALEETVAGLLRSSLKAGGSGASQAGRVHRTKTE